MAQSCSSRSVDKGTFILRMTNKVGITLALAFAVYVVFYLSYMVSSMNKDLQYEPVSTHFSK